MKIKNNKNKNKYALISIIILVVFIGVSFLVSKEICVHAVYSIRRVLVGFFIASVIGVAAGFVLGINKKISVVRYLFEILRPIPPIARIPLAILRFGLGDVSSYFIVFIGSFFPIFTNTYFGITSVPQIYLDVSHNLQLSRFDFYYKVIGKYALPYIFSGLKIGLGMGWMSLIAAELIGAQSGLGYYIQINRLTLNMGNVILGMIIIGMIGFCLNYGLSKIETILVRWK